MEVYFPHYLGNYLYFEIILIIIYHFPISFYLFFLENFSYLK